MIKLRFIAVIFNQLGFCLVLLFPIQPFNPHQIHRPYAPPPWPLGCKEQCIGTGASQQPQGYKTSSPCLLRRDWSHFGTLDVNRPRNRHESALLSNYQMNTHWNDQLTTRPYGHPKWCTVCMVSSGFWNVTLIASPKHFYTIAPLKTLTVSPLQTLLLTCPTNGELWWMACVMFFHQTLSLDSFSLRFTMS